MTEKKKEPIEFKQEETGPKSGDMLITVDFNPQTGYHAFTLKVFQNATDPTTGEVVLKPTIVYGTHDEKLAARWAKEYGIECPELGEGQVTGVYNTIVNGEDEPCKFLEWSTGDEYAGFAIIEDREGRAKGVQLKDITFI